MKRNGYSIPELLVLIVGLGLVMLGVITMTSNAFVDNSEDLYNDKVYLIEHQAAIYGKTLNNLADEGYLIITLQDLIDHGYYITDDDSHTVVDPRNSKATLNDIKIKLVYNGEDDVTATVLKED